MRSYSYFSQILILELFIAFRHVYNGEPYSKLRITHFPSEQISITQNFPCNYDRIQRRQIDAISLDRDKVSELVEPQHLQNSKNSNTKRSLHHVIHWNCMVSCCLVLYTVLYIILPTNPIYVLCGKYKRSKRSRPLFRNINYTL